MKERGRRSCRTLSTMPCITPLPTMASAYMWRYACATREHGWRTTEPPHSHVRSDSSTLVRKHTTRGGWRWSGEGEA